MDGDQNQGPQPRAQGYPFGPGDPVTPDADAPRGNRFNYQPTPRRPHTEWGEPDDHLRFAQSYGAVVPGPWWPQPDQIPRLLGQGPTSLNNLMQISSGNGQRNSLATMTYLAAYLKAKQAAQDEEPRRESEALRLSLEKQTAELDAEARDYADVLARKNLNPEQIHQAMTKIAYKHNDNNLIQTINAGDWAGAEEMLKEREARSQDYKKMIETMNSQRRADDEHKAAEEKETEKENERKSRLDPLQHEPSTYTPPPLPSLDASETPGASVAPGRPAAEPPTQPAVPGEAGAGAPAGGGGAAPAAAPPAGDNAGGVSIPGVTQATPEQDAPRTDVAGAPTQYPQTAMAGDIMSDAPPIGMRPGDQTAQATQAPDPYQQARQQELNSSPALTSGATGPYHMINRPQVDQDAQDMVTGTSKMTYKTNPEEFPVAQARADEIKRRLADIANSRLSPQQALDEVRKVLPAFAGQLLATVKGDAPAPTPSSRNPMAPYIMALGKKIDPTFDENQYRVRYNTLKSVTSGPISRSLTGFVVTEDHIELLRDLGRKIPYIYALGPDGNKQFQDWLTGKASGISTGILSAFSRVDLNEMRDNIFRYNNVMNQVAPEIARTQMGGNVPHAPELKRTVDSLGLDKPPTAREGTFRDVQALAWHRVQETALNAASALNMRKIDPRTGTTVDPQGRPTPLDPNRLLAPFGRVVENPNQYNDGGPPLAGARPGFDAAGTMQNFINTPAPLMDAQGHVILQSPTSGSLKGTGYSFEP